MKFSVLLSVYHKEKASNLRECFDSLLGQSLLPDEIVLVFDGPLSDELYQTIDDIRKQIENCYQSISFVCVPLEKNRGLGLALAEGIKHCSNELIARMDTDDIALPKRFELQCEAFSRNPDLDIVGGYISEFAVDTDHITGERQVPLTCHGIYQYQRKRDAFNHMTVMYKKQAVLDAGNYQSCLLMEDSLLWAHMIKNHCRMANLAQTLVYARTGEDMIKRRGGMDYFFKYRSGRKRILKTGTISHWDYFFTVAVQLVVCVMPVWLRTFFFEKVLRN